MLLIYLGRTWFPISDTVIYPHRVKPFYSIEEGKHDSPPVHQEEEFFFFAWSELKSSRQGMTRNGLFQLIKRMGKRAGVSGVRCSPHTFRHTFAVTYLRNGGDVFSLQQILGHTDLKMTRRYVALANADVEAAHKKFSPGDSLKRR